MHHRQEKQGRGAVHHRHACKNKRVTLSAHHCSVALACERARCTSTFKALHTKEEQPPFTKALAQAMAKKHPGSPHLAGDHSRAQLAAKEPDIFLKT